MGIVKNARKTVKIKYYFLTSNDDYNNVRDIMSLFNLEYSGIMLQEDVLGLPDQAILISNYFSEESKTFSICTKVFFHSDEGITSEFKNYNGEFQDRKSSRLIIKRLISLHVLTILKNITGYDTGPWGILRGVRPSKIVHNLIDRGYKATDIIKVLQCDYAVDIEKATLITDIAFRQRPFLNTCGDSRKISIYIGIPFCPSRCLYCSFPGNVLPESSKVNEFLATLQKDILAARRIIQEFELEVQAVYIGGGTPTSLNSDDFTWLLKFVKESLVSNKTVEFTVEAGRPDSVGERKIMSMAYYGVNRVSVNPQSMQQKTLNRIGRNHTTEDIISLFHNFRQIGIPIINMDVIIGLPGENEKDVTNTLQQIVDLGPDNLTIHTLALKRGSRLKDCLTDYMLPDVETTRNMFEIAMEYAYKLGMNPYYLYRQKNMRGNLENVGFSKQGLECVYNIDVMEERRTIIGIGPAATSKAVDVNTWRLQSSYNAKDVATYVNRLDKYLTSRNVIILELFSK